MSHRRFALRVAAVAFATVTAVVVSSPDSTPEATAQETFTLQTPVSPARCGTVTAKVTGDTSSPTPVSSWTFTQNSSIEIEATAAAGCTFSGWNILHPDGSVLTWTANPTRFQLSGDIKATAHFTGTPTATATAPTGFTATAGSGQIRLAWTDPFDATITKYQVRYQVGTSLWLSWAGHLGQQRLDHVAHSGRAPQRCEAHGRVAGRSGN